MTVITCLFLLAVIVAQGFMLARSHQRELELQQALASAHAALLVSAGYDLERT